MTSTQKIIKYFAIALAIVLIISIFSAIISGITGIFYFLDDSDADITGDMTEIYTGDTPTSLDIEIGAAKLKVEKGTSFSVLSNNKKITAKKDGDTLEIEEKSHRWNMKSSDTALVITIPENISFKNFSLDIGAGNISIEMLTADTVELDIGAADFEAQYLSAKKRIDADLGAGDFSIRSGWLNAPDFDLGVGKTDVTATIEGDGDFDCGVGEMTLTIYDSPSDYTIRASRGIGDFTVDGETVSDGDVIGNGANTLRISGGVGKITVSFLQD
ncbi:MAG: DUF4097 family beta strand repeat protein [Clostridia bacterium]|nr:DUF4097 family beta strand repeat protein [Clostridia bacterium]